MNRDSRASTKKKMTAAGRRMNNVETTEYSDSQYDDEGQFDAQYPERISIVLTKSNKKRSPSFLFTNGDDRNHIEFEGSDDDPELQSDSNDSDTEKEQWEKVKQQVTGDKRAKKEAITRGGYGSRSGKVNLVKDRFQQEPNPAEESGSNITDDYVAVLDSHVRKSQKSSRTPKAPPKEEIKNKNKEKKHIKPPTKDIKKPVKLPSEEIEETLSEEELSQQTSEQISFKKNKRQPNKEEPKDAGKVDLQIFNDMASNYKAKVEALQDEIATLTENLRQNSKQAPQKSQPNRENTKNDQQIIRHLSQAEALFEGCIAELDSNEAKIAKLYRCINSMDGKREGRSINDEHGTKYKLEQDINDFLQDNECLIYDLQSNKQPTKESFKDSLEKNNLQRKDWSPRRQIVEPARPEIIDVEKIKKNIESEMLVKLDQALAGQNSRSLEDALESVRQISAEVFSTKAILSTWGEKEKSLQKQLIISRAEFDRISDDKIRLENKLRETESEMNMLRIEQINCATEKKSQISESAKNIEIDAQFSRLEREIEERDLMIEKLKEELSQQKTIEPPMPVIERAPQSPKTQQRSNADPEICQMLEYINSMIVGEGYKNNQASAELAKRFKSSPYADQLMLLDRLIQMQASKQQVLAETYRDKFLNDNILLDEIGKRLRLLADLLAMIDESKTSDKDADTLLSEIQDLAGRSHKKAIHMLINDVLKMKYKNDTAIRNAISGDIDGFMHECAVNEPYGSLIDRSRSGDEITFANNGQSQKQSINSQSRALAPVDQSPPFGPYSGRRQPAGDRRRSQNFKKKPSNEGEEEEEHRENLMHLLVSQSKAIEKYGEN